MTKTCPECDSRVETMSTKEEVCTVCGLVVDDTCINYGPDWRAYDASEQEDHARAGPPETELMHDRGLSTVIGWQDKDASGNSLSATKKKQLKRLRKWDERYRTEDSQARNLQQALAEIQRMSSSLDVSTTVRETAASVYRDALGGNIVKGRSIEGMASATLYAACRIHQVPVTLDNVSDVSRVRVEMDVDYQATLTDTQSRADRDEKKRERVKSDYQYLCKELALPTPVPEPHRFVPRITSTLDVATETETMGVRLLQTVEDNDEHAGLRPIALAAAAVYAANIVRGQPQHVTQADVSGVAGVSDVTVRKRYQEILEVNGYDPNLADPGKHPDQHTVLEGDV